MDPSNVAKIISGVGVVDGLFDNLQLHSTSGHFSAVFKARHLRSGSDCALKFLADRGSPERSLAFAREGQLLEDVFRGEARFVVPLVAAPSKLVQDLAHPSGATVTLEFPYLALEWLPRGTPEQFSRPARGHAELLHRLALIKSMTHALSRTHYLRVAHRDVKPSNFLLVSRNAAKLSDFGSALHLTRTPSDYASPPRGDRRYTAPEIFVPAQWHSDVYYAADIYGLGCTAFELITGYPFVGHSVFGGLGGAIKFQAVVANLPDRARIQKYHEYLDTGPFRFPDLRNINPDLPRCSYPPLTRLLTSMCHFDYRLREASFDAIHRLLRISTLVVGNEYREICNRGRSRRVRASVTS